MAGEFLRGSKLASRPDAATAHNARAWDALARQGVGLATPATDADFRDPLKTVDPAGWLGGDIRGWRVLCLAAGGGRQGALYAAAGAQVTVVDISGEMLALDREVAAERGLAMRLVQASMEDLSMLAEGEFDLVIHPVSTCYVADVRPVFASVARVTRPGGLYVSQHKSPVSLQASTQVVAGGQTLAGGSRPPLAGGGYMLQEPYYREGALPAAETSHLREAGTLEFLHRWEELIGGMCGAGFVVEDLCEPLHAKPQATVGSFAHRAAYIAPYVRIKARKTSNASPRPASLVVRAGVEKFQ